MSNNMSREKLEEMSPEELGKLLLFHFLTKRSNSDIEYCRDLLSLGADTETTDQYGKTCLIYAAQYCQSNMIELLISMGSDLEAKEEDDWTPLHYAVYSDRINIVSTLLAAGAYLEAKDKNGWEPLHVAAYYEKVEVAELLIAVGAPLDEPNKYYQIPWELASSKMKEKTPQLNPNYNG